MCARATFSINNVCPLLNAFQLEKDFSDREKENFKTDQSPDSGDMGLLYTFPFFSNDFVENRVIIGVT